MDTLLHSAEIRKRDFLISQERKYQKERETEGDQYAEKEKFVTTGYKKQQDELRKQEEAERRKEGTSSPFKQRRFLMVELAKKNRGMASFYRNMLEEEEFKHDMAVKAARDAALGEKTTTKLLETEEEERSREKKLADEAREINKQMGTDAILINEDGEVVDKRQLLKGGLNVRPKAQQEQLQVTQSAFQLEYNARRDAQRDRLKERETRQRQQRVIEEQYAMTKKRALDAEAEREEEIKLRAKSKKSNEEVMNARERYLSRKKAAIQV
jgi:coiled-coil domain-containing protein 55